MKKSLATLLAAILLLACIPALADEAPTARTHFAELGLDVDITAITDKCVYTASVETEGILSLDPYIAMADVYYCALPQKQLLELKDGRHVWRCHFRHAHPANSLTCRQQACEICRRA